MSIKQESDKIYTVKHSQRHPSTGIPKGLTRTKIKTLPEAKRIEKELVVLLHEKFKVDTVPKWSKVLNEYYETFVNLDLTNKTMHNRKITLNLHTACWNDKFINEIKTQDVYALIGERFKNSSEATKKSFVKCIRYVFNYALEKDYILRNPTPLIKFKASEKIKAVLNEQQIETLLQKADETGYEWHPHYAMATFTGLRNGELFALEWSNVDLEKRLIYVKKSWTKSDGFKDTKSGDDRVVEIPNPLLPVLHDLKAKSDGTTFVLPRLGSWDSGDQARYLRLFLQAVGGLPIIRFHDLRASWATLLLSKGTPPSQVMSMGGWKNIQTMMIYMRKAGIDIKGSTNVLDCMKPYTQKSSEIIDINDRRR